MNAVEIEEAVSTLAEAGFDSQEFPFALLAAFGAKETTLKRLRKGDTNRSDVGGVLQRGNIHLKVADSGTVAQTLSSLRNSPQTSRAKARFILSTDGDDFQAEDIISGETVACDYSQFPDHFGFFLPLAGIATVAAIRESSFDIKATGRLNRLYIELLNENSEWGTQERRSDMNHFMARLIFCFFSEDTDIFGGDDVFTNTIEQMSASDSSNTHEVVSEIFRSMDTPLKYRESTGIPRWACKFPHVNGGLFAGVAEVPRFSRRARSYLLHIGKLDWIKINPDIFGSMIQGVADDEERGSLGMHYTSVPNILKVLNPMLLDGLREKLADAAGNPRKLLNLRNRISRIRVFDPACGSGNFLVIAYKNLRELEADIDVQRGEEGRSTEIPITNFRGIEIREFSAEIARLALIIAEYQCDVRFRGQKEAIEEFLPLDTDNWITCGNALRLDWLSICPPTGTAVSHAADDLFHASTEDHPVIDFQNEGGETYICGNPPYLGSTWQSNDQKSDLQAIFDGRVKGWKSLDYVAGWFMKAADFGVHTISTAAFVSTNSINQGQQVPILWPAIYATGHEIVFAHTSFKWSNLASHNAGVMVAIIGISNHPGSARKLFSLGEGGDTTQKIVPVINAYLVAGPEVIVSKVSLPLFNLSAMSFGNKPVDGGHLLMTRQEAEKLGLTHEQHSRFIRRIFGSAEFIRGLERYVLWIEDENLSEALEIKPIRERIEKVREMRLASRDKGANKMAKTAHQMREMRIGQNWTLTVPRTSSENRPFLPNGLIDKNSTVTSEAFALFDAPFWNMALIASRLHLVWVGTVCGKMKTDFRYSNTLGWNTFPVPRLTEKNKADLSLCAEDILLAREAHFPASIADLYDPETMPPNLQKAHNRNDEVLERIYIGRRFRNDTERLEKLFQLYTKMTTIPE